MKKTQLILFSCIILLQLISVRANAQKLDSINLNKYPIFGNKVEISGLTGSKDSYYLAAEKCKIIYVMDKNWVLQRKIDLNKGILAAKFIAVEALARYKNYILFTNESKSASIYMLDLKTEEVAEITTDNNDLKTDIGDFGTEGIAVDERRKICYLLKERTEDFNSKIRVFRIVEHRNRISLKYKRTIEIKHSLLNIARDNTRYSDIYFDPSDSYLYGLRTYYDKAAGHTKSLYYIDRLAAANYKKIPNGVNAQTLEYQNISTAVIAYGKSYSNNLEGMYIENDMIYLISDNCNCEDGQCYSDEKASKPTLLLQLGK